MTSPQSSQLAGDKTLASLDGEPLDLAATVEMLRELSRQTDPQKLVEVFRARSEGQLGGYYLLSSSRRGLEAPWYRITRHADWPASFNPWERRDELPLLKGGLLGELTYCDEPRIINDVVIPPDDPAREYLGQARSLLALPQYDSGVGLNVVVRMSREPGFFDEALLADTLVVSNLFGRAIYGQVVARELRETNAELDRELKSVGRIQRSLLPQTLPKLAGANLAVSYETATRAGGDYYDVLELPDGRWGILIADVSGHGAPAAVVMAILRTILHTQRIDKSKPARVLQLLNDELSNHSGADAGTFVTAFYAVYDPAARLLRYSCAGHLPPILLDQNCQPRELAEAQSLPLAILPGTEFNEASTTLSPGDKVVLYTDGITEAADLRGEMFGKQRMLGAVCRRGCSAQDIVDSVNRAVNDFVGHTQRQDDQTLLVLRME